MLCFTYKPIKRGRRVRAVRIAVCRKFHVDEMWLHTGNGEMFIEPEETTANISAPEYELDDLGRKLLNAYLKLNDSDRLAVGRMMRNFIEECISDKI